MQYHGGWAEGDGPGGRRPDIGVLRSDDHGRTWRSIAPGRPSAFGFPLVVNPPQPDTLYDVPLEPMTRTRPGGVPAVWRIISPRFEMVATALGEAHSRAN